MIEGMREGCQEQSGLLVGSDGSGRHGHKSHGVSGNVCIDDRREDGRFWYVNS